MLFNRIILILSCVLIAAGLFYLYQYYIFQRPTRFIETDGASHWIDGPELINAEVFSECGKGVEIVADVDYSKCQNLGIFLDAQSFVELSPAQAQLLEVDTRKYVGYLLLCRGIQADGASRSVCCADNCSRLWIRVGVLSRTGEIAIQKRPIVLCVTRIPKQVVLDLAVAK